MNTNRLRNFVTSVLALVAMLMLTTVRRAYVYYAMLDGIDRQIEQNLPAAQVIDVQTQPRASLLDGSDDLPSEIPLRPLASRFIPTPFLPAENGSTAGELFS